MALSRPIYNLLGVYFEQLYNHPIRTKSVSSCILAATANYASQKIAGQKRINQDSLLAYGLFGLIFGGTVPHFFYQTVERLLSRNLKFRKFFLFLAERLTFAPFYQMLSLYFLSRFERNTHEIALVNMKKLYWPLLRANWQYLSVAVFINMNYVPPMMRTLTFNIVSFVWVIYIARKRKRLQDKQAANSSSSESTRDSSSSGITRDLSKKF